MSENNAFGSLAFCHFSEVVYGSSTYLLRQWYLLWNIHCTQYSLRIRMKMSRKMNTGKLHLCYILCYFSVFAKYWTWNLTWHCIGVDLPEASLFLYFFLNISLSLWSRSQFQAKVYISNPSTFLMGPSTIRISVNGGPSCRLEARLPSFQNCFNKVEHFLRIRYEVGQRNM